MKRIAFLLCMGFLSQAHAADITTLQAALEAARQNMESAKSKYDDAGTALSYQKKNVERIKIQLAKEQQKLVEDEKAAASAREDYYAAKARHDRAQAILDEAWGKR